MDIIGFMNAANKAGRYIILAVFVANLLSVSYAQSQAAYNIGDTMRQLCNISQTFLGAAVMVLIVLAGVTYAIGQILGAETRARATVWATAMLTGALIGAVIYIVTPMILNSLLGLTTGTTNPCDFGTPT